VICGVISCESDDLITNLLQLTQNSKSDKKNGARNFDSATVFYDHGSTSQNGLRPHSGPRTSICALLCGRKMSF
jgi:hypothetical protein